MPSENFFSRLPSFGNFLDFEKATHYQAPAADWQIMITDVQGSTEAIKAGRYKVVNMLGASSIAAIMNSAGTVDLPFSFGGDGATALIPANQVEEAKKALRSVKRYALENHGIKFRVGLVPLSEIFAKGAKVEVAKYALGGGPCIAFFRGDGVSLAEQWVKSGKFEIEDGPETPIHVALKGLSCRWDPVPSSQGCILSILVKARGQGDKAQHLTEVLREIDKIVDLSSAESNPVKGENLRPSDLAQATNLEIGHLSIRPRFLAQLVVIGQIFLLQIFKKFNWSIRGIKIRDYLNDQSSHSDSHKFDETLRIVVDCDLGKRDQIVELLERSRDAGTIFFGVHEAKSALLTCLVQSLAKGKHIHFVDGNDGGYALAAQQLKRQMDEHG